MRSSPTNDHAADGLCHGATSANDGRATSTYDAGQPPAYADAGAAQLLRKHAGHANDTGSAISPEILIDFDRSNPTNILAQTIFVWMKNTACTLRSIDLN